MAKANDDQRIPEAQDVAPSNEYHTLESLLRDSRIRQWTQAKTGRKMIKHFGWLLQCARRNQNSWCDICDSKLDDVEDVGQNQGYVVHRTCAEWPNKIGKQVQQSLKAYSLSKYPS
jgi:hypothetical protein